jgi:hypothetical protein
VLDCLIKEEPLSGDEHLFFAKQLDPAMQTSASNASPFNVRQILRIREGAEFLDRLFHNQTMDLAARFSERI